MGATDLSEDARLNAMAATIKMENIAQKPCKNPYNKQPEIPLLQVARFCCSLIMIQTLGQRDIVKFGYIMTSLKNLYGFS